MPKLRDKTQLLPEFEPADIDKIKELQEMMPRIVSKVIHHAKFHSTWIEFEDLVSAGNEAVISQFHYFRNDGKCGINGYLISKAKFAVINELYKLRHYGTGIVAQKNKIDKAIKSLTEQLGRAPTVAEICKKARMSKLRFESTMEKSAPVTVTSFDDAEFEAVKDTLKDLAALPPIEHIVAREKICILRHAVTTLNPRHRHVIDQIYYHETPRLQAGKGINCSADTTRAYHQKGVENLIIAMRQEYQMPELREDVASQAAHDFVRQYDKPFMRGQKSKWDAQARIGKAA